MDHTTRGRSVRVGRCKFPRQDCRATNARGTRRPAVAQEPSAHGPSRGQPESSRCNKNWARFAHDPAQQSCRVYRPLSTLVVVPASTSHNLRPPRRRNGRRRREILPPIQRSLVRPRHGGQGCCFPCRAGSAAEAAAHLCPPRPPKVRAVSLPFGCSG
jgi:hypothetical protein